jgi:hypothetical protein
MERRSSSSAIPDWACGLTGEDSRVNPEKKIQGRKKDDARQVFDWGG